MDDIWDGKELEDQPEMVYDDIKSFEEIDDGVIQHFSHPHHHLRLIKDVYKSYDEHQQCQVCILPVYGSVYRCMQCDFALHEECANLPRIKRYVMHPHRLLLKPIGTPNVFLCSFCYRFSCGFKYVCNDSCTDFHVDVRCATLSEGVNLHSHLHPLVLIFQQRSFLACSTCGNKFYRSLICFECDFALCFHCATIPYNVKHEGDEHILTLSYDNNSNSPYWCEVCEETTNPKKGYYACNECGVIFHIECILGKDLYMKAGSIILMSKSSINILLNNGLNRPICNHCRKRCKYKIVFKTSQGTIFCSFWEAIHDSSLRMSYLRLF